MKKALLAVALFIFCIVSYSKELYDDFTPPEVIEQGQCMFVTLALANKYIKQVESLFDSKESLERFRWYALGIYQCDCQIAIEERFLAGADLEKHIKNTINKLALQYRGYFRKIAEEVMRRMRSKGDE